jgi:DNA-binding XRE family transcriptional regulator
MVHYIANVSIVALTAKCGHTIYMEAGFNRQRIEDEKAFWCTVCGDERHYGSNTETGRLRAELQKTQGELDRARQAESRAREKTGQIARSYKRVRDRIRNGVCPCCNRTFQNLANHMRTEHADYGETKTLRAVRNAFGLTQQQLATEAGVNPAYVSHFERGTDIPKWAANRLTAWLAEQTAAA